MSTKHQTTTSNANECGKVSHNYHDRLQEAEQLERLQDMISSSNTSNSNTSSSNKNKNQARIVDNGPFPLKLHYMLEESGKQDLSHIVSWQSHGRAFAVRNKAEFLEKILPQFFNQTKMTSFQRQLSLYGFKRLTKGSDKGAYYHECFLRNSPQLAKRIARTKVNGNQTRKAAAPEEEPDFYSMPSVPSKNEKRQPSATPASTVSAATTSPTSNLHRGTQQEEQLRTALPPLALSQNARLQQGVLQLPPAASPTLQSRLTSLASGNADQYALERMLSRQDVLSAELKLALQNRVLLSQSQTAPTIASSLLAPQFSMGIPSQLMNANLPSDFSIANPRDEMLNYISRFYFR